MKQDYVTDSEFLDDVEQNFGVPEYNRRLTDKVLAAFNHAYAAGERDIARQLRAILDEIERRVKKLGRKRHSNGAVDDADRWIIFVDARDRYREVSKDPRFSSSEVGEALDEMKEAFRIWSLT
jgi:hypothetical protein